MALESAAGGPSAWAAIAAHVTQWAASREVPLRGAVVLVPFRQLLMPARQAFADAGGWMPRIETTQTLALALGPAPAYEAGQIRFDAAMDALAAAQLLRGQAWGAAWARRDARGFARAVSDVVTIAHALAFAAAAVPPALRADYWMQGRALLGPAPGPGGDERLLARIALEWASLAPAPATDRLFDLRPGAWIVVQAGGCDPLSAALLAACDEETPCLLVDTDADPEQPFNRLDHAAAPAIVVCAGFEDEAQAAAAQVLAHLQAGDEPIALIAQDRVLVRRVRALLERHRVSLRDETGWKLSTTRAATVVVGLLQSARADAPTDALLDWLKSVASTSAAPGLAQRVEALEAACRTKQLRRVALLAGAQLEPALGAWWADLASTFARFATQPRQCLSAWLESMAPTLRASGAWAGLMGDEAGRQVITALHLDRPPAAATTRWNLSFDDFTAWVRDVLEQETFRPAAAASASVVITPLARALLRPFAAMVLPGADDRHLGAGIAPLPLLSDQQAAALGLPTAAERRAAEVSAFVHALAVPRLTLLRRRADGGAPVAASPLVERLEAALVRRGRALAAWQDPRDTRIVAATPIRRSAPSAPELLPDRLSASAVEALRACPYRFFALNMLRLREDDELDGEIEKRDYGNWLHAVLHRFHTERGSGASTADDIVRLQQIALETQQEFALDDAEFLPYAASFAHFAPRYVAWLALRDAAGISWLHGEYRLEMAPEALGGAKLHGVLDRVDTGLAGQNLELIDYKTGSVTGLQKKVAQPLEDTQLAVYAALMGSRSDLPLQANYLALDANTGILPIAHPEVAVSAAALLDGLGGELARLRAGHGLPALGEGATCDYCAARGICRRDHWSA